MQESVKAFLGEEIVNSLPEPKLVDPTTMGTKTTTNPIESVSQTRRIRITPEVAALFLMSNEWYAVNHDRSVNRPIPTSRTEAEIKMLFDLMVNDQFAPYRGVVGITEDGRLIEAQGRMLAQLKAGKTYEYTVDIVRNDQTSVAKYLGSSRGTTSPTSPSEMWGLYFNLKKKPAQIGQQVFNGLLWHDLDLLGTTIRTSTKAATVEQTSLPRDLREIALLYAGLKVPKNINISALATTEILARRAGFSDKKIIDFREGVLSGVGLGARDSRKVVRDFLMSRPKGKTMRYQVQIAYLKWAFDKFLMGTDVLKVGKVDVVRF